MSIVLSASDDLPDGTRRLLVAGVSGSGKSTFAAALGTHLGAPYTEIDSMYHGPGWVPRPQFVGEVDAMIAADSWVTEWQYRIVRERLLDRADALVWLDYPFRTTMIRATRRTLRRRLRREVLWHGNTEPPLHTFFTRPDENILRWTIATREKYRETLPVVDAARPDLPIFRLSTPDEADAWLARQRPIGSAPR